MTTAEPILRIEGLEIQFSSPLGPVQAVNGVSLDICRGETLGLLGESGSGKSTIGYAILQLLRREGTRITAGRILLEGEDLVQASDRRMQVIRGRLVAMIFQEAMSALNPVYTIGEQIAEVLRHHERASRRAARRRARELCDLVGMTDPERRLDTYPHQLSGGLRQRAMIAVALACRPKLLIADEPTTALDVTLQAQILELIRDLQRETGMAVLFISHDLGVVSEIADRTAVLYGGRIVEEGATQTLLQRPLMPYTRGLLDSLPQAATGRRLSTIPGGVPDPRSLPSGCAFHPRCQSAIDDCAVSAPPIEQVEAGRQVRCIRWRELLANSSEALA